MSHGIKGLLTALDGGVYQMESGLAKGDLEQARAGWDMLRLRIERIRKMVLDVLYYAKSRDLELTEVDLGGFVEDLAAVIRPKAEQAGVTFAPDFTGVHGTIEADPVALSSAMVNFLENALDACHMDRTKKEHTVTFSTKRLGSRIAFEIADNGLGMDQETRNNLFTLFFSSKGSRGTGIGLYVSNHVITQHHGHISVESEFGKGTRIQVEIPARQTPSPQSIGYSKDAERPILGAAELH